MNFCYRYVDFGTKFYSAKGNRDEKITADESRARILYENEIAVDIGGVCWDNHNSTLPVIDHHFNKDRGQFPSAAAAVLHHAELILDRFENVSGPIWLVTHKYPDFDAFAAMYLVRCILEEVESDRKIPATGWCQYGVEPLSWRTSQNPQKEIDWFKPNASAFEKKYRWPTYIAMVASCVDQCVRMSCPNTRSLNSILYAAIVRGRDFQSTGACEFFDEVRTCLDGDPVPNPFFDSVLEDSHQFRPEIELLDNQPQAYNRDIKRARKAVVSIPRSEKPFRDWYDEAIKHSLLSDDMQIDPIHVKIDDRIQVDGLYIRDPECILFKEWARQDLDNSSLAKGFMFTAIARSGDRASSVNNSDYFFSLDPERARIERLNLYSVWASLQAAELKALIDSNANTKITCREGYKERAGTLIRFFDDPWFDGVNYESTIIATPGRGTYIGKAGQSGDLSDDPIVAKVVTLLESSVLAGEVVVSDLSIVTDTELKWQAQSFEEALFQLKPSDGKKFRLGKLKLDESMNPVDSRRAGEQIGRQLWKILNPLEVGVPDDFLSRHLVLTPDSVQVWGRSGIVIASRLSYSSKLMSIEDDFRDMIALSRDVETLATSESLKDHELQELILNGDKKVQQISILLKKLSCPDNRLLRLFFDSTNLARILDSVHDANNRISNARIARRLEDNVLHVADMQNAAEWLELFIISFYSLEMAIILSHHAFHFNEWFRSWGVIVVALVSTSLMAFAIQPWKYKSNTQNLERDNESTNHEKGHSRSRLPLALLLVIVVQIGFVVFGVITSVPVHKDHEDSISKEEIETTIIELQRAADSLENSAQSLQSVLREFQSTSKASETNQLERSSESPKQTNQPLSPPDVITAPLVDELK
jgi:hypothetical protein